MLCNLETKGKMSRVRNVNGCTSYFSLIHLYVLRILVDSYYKMTITFFVPRPSPDQSTEPNRLKFDMVSYLVILRGLVEGFFSISIWGLRYGVPLGAPMVHFFTEIGTWISKSLLKVKTSLKFGDFEWIFDVQSRKGLPWGLKIWKNFENRFFNFF